jgi:hypothetical protein
LGDFLPNVVSTAKREKISQNVVSTAKREKISQNVVSTAKRLILKKKRNMGY